jgi:hypothetical protein
MPFDWREFLIIAHELRNQASEGAQRTSLSRAYYYVFNLGLNHATRLGFRSTRNSPLHKQLWDWYNRQTNPDIRQMGFTGNRMRSFRVQADYHNSIPDLAVKVRRQLESAQEFETLVAQSNGQPPPPRLNVP